MPRIRHTIVSILSRAFNTVDLHLEPKLRIVDINIIIERGTLRIQKNDQKLSTNAAFKWS